MKSTYFTKSRISTRFLTIAESAALLLLVGLSVLALGGCDGLKCLNLPGPSASDGSKVELQVWFLGADDNFLKDLGINLNETFLVEEDVCSPIALPSSRNATLLVSPTVAGGAENTQTLIPRNAPVGAFLPVAVPFASGTNSQSKVPQPTLVAGTLDIPNSQVLVSVRFMQISQDPLRDLGVDFTVLPELNDLPTGKIVQPLITPEVHSLSGAFLDDLQLQTVLNALQQKSSFRTLASPKITVLNNQQAVITVRNELGFASELEPKFAEAVNELNPQAEFIEGGITLDVRPVISADRRFVVMEIHPATTGVVVDFDRQFDDSNGQMVSIEVPVIQLARVQTTVSVPDGGTVLLGGIKRSGDAEADAGVPLFSRIPVINRFFKNQAAIKDEQTLLILIKPKIVLQDES